MVKDKNKTKNEATKKSGGQIKVTQIRSKSGHPIDQIRTLRGLGLNKIGKVSVLEDTPSVRGMVNKIEHLVKFEKI
jgi:large subunit ribosomal protein L30